MTSFSTSATQTRHAWLMLSLFLVPATLIMAVDRAVVTIAAPMLQSKFKLTLSQLGLLFSSFFWAYAAMQIPAGAFVQRFGSKRPLLIAIILWSAMTAMTPFAGGFATLLIVRAMLGIGQSADWPAAIVGINRLFGAERRPTANSMLLCALYLGPVFGAPLTGVLLAKMGLEGVFLLCAGIGLAFAVLWGAFYSDGIPLSHSTFDGATGSSPRLRAPFLLVVSRGWALAITYAFTGFLIAFYLSWFATYLAKDRHLDVTQLGTFSGISAAALCVGVLIAGRALRRLTGSVSSLRMARLPVGILSLSVAGVATVLLPRFQSDINVLLMACLAMVGLAFSQVVTWSTVQDIGGSATGLITGIVSLCGNLAAGAAPVLSAVLVEKTGSWSASLFMIGAIVSIGSLSWLFVRLDQPIDPS